MNTENKNNFIFEYEELVIEVSGGINDDKLDSLRVTLKIYLREKSYNAVRHNVNLFNHTQVEKLIGGVSSQLEFNDITIRKAFMKLTGELEQYRLDHPSGEVAAAIDYELPEAERKLAEDLLISPDLLTKTNELIGASGVIGEENNRLLMYLIFTSRITSNPLHCISFGSSGAGKTHLQSKIASLIPDEDKKEITQLSASAIYYVGKDKLKNKLVLIEDMDGAEEALLPLRELQTKKRISKSVVQKGLGGVGRTQQQIVEGPICLAGCTTKSSIYEDNANRSFLLYIDESSEQDERIMQYQRLGFAGKIDVDAEETAAKLLRNVQRLLNPIKVVNPFAEHLILPKTVFKPRRTNMHYLQLIEVITFYHQMQREKRYDKQTGEEYIETTLEDILLANTLIKDVLLRKSDRLNGVTRDYFESLNVYLKSENKTTYSNQEIRREFRISEPTLRRYHKLLLEEGYIRKVGGDKKSSYQYEVQNVNEFKDLEATIEKALAFCLESVTSSQVRHS